MIEGQLTELIEKTNQAYARKKLISLFDADSFIELEPFSSTESVITASGVINGKRVFAFAQNIQEEKGAVTKAHGEKLERLYKLAEETGVPIIGFFDSFGGKISDGVCAINGYASWLSAVNKMSGVVPQIAVIDGACIGAAAMIASAFDFVIFTQGGELSLTPAFLKEKAENSCGFEKRADIIARSDEEAILKVRELLAYLPINNLSEPDLFSYLEPESIAYDGISKDELISTVCDKDSVLELQKEFGKCVRIFFARMFGRSVGIVSVTSKKICADGMTKAARFIRFCDAFHIPIITFAGVSEFCENEDDIITLTAVSQLSHAYAEATAPKISVITGEVYGALAVIFAGKGIASDWTVAWENVAISPISPISAVELLYRDKLKEAENISEKRRELAEDYKNKNASVLKAMDFASVDSIIFPEDTRVTLKKTLDILQTKRVAVKPKKHSNIAL